MLGGVAGGSGLAARPCVAGIATPAAALGALNDSTLLLLLLLVMLKLSLLPAERAGSSSMLVALKLGPLLPAAADDLLSLLVKDRPRATLRENALKLSLNFPDKLPTATVSSTSGTSFSWV